MSRRADIESLREQIARLPGDQERIKLAIELCEASRGEYELTLKKWTLALGIVGAVLAFGGLWHQAESAASLRRQELHQRQKDYSNTFYQAQMETYKDLCALLSRVANDEKPPPETIRELDAFIVSRVWLLANSEVVVAVGDLTRQLKIEAGMDNAVAGGKILGRLPGEKFEPRSEMIGKVIDAGRRSMIRAFPDTQLGQMEPKWMR
jgi:hypothetical protein